MGRRKDADAGGGPELVDSVGMTILPGRPLPEWAVGEMAVGTQPVPGMELPVGPIADGAAQAPAHGSTEGLATGLPAGPPGNPATAAGQAVPGTYASGGAPVASAAFPAPATPPEHASVPGHTMPGYPAHLGSPTPAGYPAMPGSAAQPGSPTPAGPAGYGEFASHPAAAAAGAPRADIPTGMSEGQPQGMADFEMALVGAPQLAPGRSWNATQPAPDASAMGLSAEPGTGTEMPAAAMPGIGSPAPGIPMAGMPMAGMPMAGMPTAGMPMAGMPTAGLPAPGMPTAGMAAPGMPATGVGQAPGAGWGSPPSGLGSPPAQTLGTTPTGMGVATAPSDRASSSSMASMSGPAAPGGTLPPSTGWASPDRPELSPEHVALLTWWAEMIASGQLPAPAGSADHPAPAPTSGRQPRSRRGIAIALGAAGAALLGLAALQGPSLLQRFQGTPATIPETEIALPARVGDLVQMTGAAADEQLQPLIGLGLRPKGVTVTAAYAKDPTGPLALAVLASTAPSPTDATGQVLEWATRTGATVGKPKAGAGTTEGIVCAEVSQNPVGNPGSICAWTSGGQRGQVYAVGTTPASAAERTAQVRASMGPVPTS